MPTTIDTRFFLTHYLANSEELKTESHSKSCPELKPQRWAMKYGSTHRLLSVQDDMVTITKHAEDGISDEDEEDEGDEGTITLHLSKEAGITSEG